MLDCAKETYLSCDIYNNGAMKKESSPCLSESEINPNGIDYYSTDTDSSKTVTDLRVIAKSRKNYNLLSEHNFIDVYERLLLYKKYEHMEEEPITSNNLTSPNLTFQTISTDDEYRYLPNNQSSSNNSSIQRIPKIKYDDNIVEYGERESGIFRVDTPMISLQDTQEISEQSSGLAMKNAISFSHCGEEIIQTTKPNGSIQSLNTPEDIAFIEWNIAQNELLNMK